MNITNGPANGPSKIPAQLEQRKAKRGLTYTELWCKETAASLMVAHLRSCWQNTVVSGTDFSLPKLTYEQILEWADEHHERTGQWPKQNSGPVRAAKGETWGGVEGALFRQTRGLPGGSSIAKLLAEHRDVRNIKELQPLTIQQILEWADEHHERTGQWPKQNSGPVRAAKGETWSGVAHALFRHSRPPRW